MIVFSLFHSNGYCVFICYNISVETYWTEICDIFIGLSDEKTKKQRKTKRKKHWNKIILKFRRQKWQPRITIHSKITSISVIAFRWILMKCINIVCFGACGFSLNFRLSTIIRMTKISDKKPKWLIEVLPLHCSLPVSTRYWSKRFLKNISSCVHGMHVCVCVFVLYSSFRFLLFFSLSFRFVLIFV